MAQLRDTCIHGILDADKYIVSKYGYNVARFNEGVHNINDTYIEFGDTGVTSKLIGRTVTVRSSNSIDAGVRNNGVYINEYSCSMSVTDGFYTTFSSLVINKDGEANLYSEHKISIASPKVSLSGQLKISDDNYGTQNPSDAITNPEIGNIYFKIIS